jgi:hypothetical protein
VSVVTGLTSTFLDESCLWIIKSAGQRADWRRSQETCDFGCFVFFCRSLYIPLLWFHMSLHLMLKYICTYVYLHAWFHDSLQLMLKFQALMHETNLLPFFFIKQTVNSFIPYSIWIHQFSIPCQTYITPPLSLRHITSSFYLSALQQYVNHPYQTKLKHNRHN